MIEPRFDHKTGALSTVQKDNIIVHHGLPRTGGKKQGGTEPLKRADGKTYCQDSTSSTNNIQIYSRVRRLTPLECCRLQTVPDNYFTGSKVSESQQYKMLGNGWTIDVIVHLLSYWLKTKIK